MQIDRRRLNFRFETRRFKILECPARLPHMKLLTLTPCLLLLLFSQSLFAQQTPASPEDEVVKITSELVQLDVVVTDKDGRQITDLGQTDFEILQDGKPQKITNFSYVNTESASPRTTRQNIGK